MNHADHVNNAARGRPQLNPSTGKESHGNNERLCF